MSILKIRLAIAAGIAFIGLLFVPALFRGPHPTLRYPVIAGAYQSVPGCERIDYSPLSKINGGCLQQRYHIANPKDYGLPGEYKDNIWYRINDDAVYFNCSSFNDWCMSHVIIQNFFKVSKS
jgi:hypothetical protein